MGKTKRQRTKLHLSSKNVQNNVEQKLSKSTLPMEPVPSGNIFSALNIDIANLNTNLSEETSCTNSLKSFKSKIKDDKVLPKKDKIMLRRELLLRKIDFMNQMKKENSCRHKQKSNFITKPTNPLNEVIPTLQSLLKDKSLNTEVLDNANILKSYKLLKSEVSGSKVLPKKAKLKLRKGLLHNKIHIANHLQLQNNLRNKRKKLSIIGDTNPLHDALPSVESLGDGKRSLPKLVVSYSLKPKGIEKAAKRKQNVIAGVNLLKKVFADKNFQQNSFAKIREHVQAVVNYERENQEK